MNLSMLTESGWIWLGWCVVSTLAFARNSMRDKDQEATGGDAAIVGLSLTWLLWLVTP